MHATHTPNPHPAPTDIAIIGMACRFPGGAETPDRFFEFLLEGRDGIVPVPPDRWDNKAYYDADRQKKNRMYVDRGGFIGNMDQFDPLFFGISPAEATRVDPQHRWLLELTYELFENAGLKARELRGSDTAVYIGQFMHDYEQLQLDAAARGLMTTYSATGPSMTLTANRISYTFDLRGPSVALDTACSSSLVALDLACRAIQSGDSRLAVAGGVNILLRPELTMSICKASMLSPDCKCKSFDASANGYVRSEGAGVVMLKALEEAARDGDRVFAVIKATGVNQDGQTVGITVPSGEAQKALLLKSLRRSGLRSEALQYAEAHGTGTAVGDPIEVNALGSVLGIRAVDAPRCVVGSVKSNIGHAEAAAGMAGLIKTVLAMSRGVIPKNLHYHETNPAIDLAALNLRIADQTTPWPEPVDGIRRALVNSFGFGGTNANAILEQAPAPAPVGQDQSPAVHGPFKLLPISSKTEEGLKLQARRFAGFFAARRDGTVTGLEAASLHDVCYTAALKREHHAHRLVVRGCDDAEFAQALHEFASGAASTACIQGTVRAGGVDRLCFVFSGMGTQWAGMGRRLYDAEPVFRAAFDRCSEALQTLSGWSLRDAIFSTTDQDRVNDCAIAQPGIFSIQVALTELLSSWGIVPAAVAGHSAGEVGAAHVAGALSFDDAVRVIHHRSRLQQTTEGMGKMLAVGMTEENLRPYLKGLEDRVSIAAINSDDAITLSGEEEALQQIAAKLEDAGMFARFLKVGVPYHSPAMDRLKEPLIAALEGIQVHPPRIPLYSTVTGRLTQEGDWGADYWPKNVRAPVLFMAAIDRVVDAGFCRFLEVAPHSALSSLIEKNLSRTKTDGWVVATLKRDQDDNAALAATLAGLHAAGWPLAWSRLFPQGGRLVTLPNYAWQHASYWCEAPEVQQSRLRNLAGRGALLEAMHPLLGAKLASAGHLWQNGIDPQDHSFLADHQVEGEPVYPAAGYIEMALAVARSQLKQEAIELRDIHFKRALFLDRERPTQVETLWLPEESRVVINAADLQTGAWSNYAEAAISELPPASTEEKADLKALRRRCTGTLEHAAFYEHCRKLGLSYQGAFQPVLRASHGGDEVLSEVSVSAEVEATSAADYLLHPVTLDGAFQGIFAAVDRGYLPVHIRSLRYHRRPSGNLFSLIMIHHRDEAELRGDVQLFEADGTLCVEVLGITLKSTKTQDAAAGGSTLLYEFDWQELSIPDGSVDGRTAPAGHWILFADSTGVAARLARHLEARGQGVTLLPEPAGTDRAGPRSLGAEWVPLLKGHAPVCTGVVYLWSLNQPGCHDLPGEAIVDACDRTTILPLAVAHALDAVEWKHPLSLHWATRTAHLLSAEDPAPEPTQGALWGFGRVFTSEFSHYKVTLVDLPEAADDQVCNAWARQLLEGPYEQEVAFRPSRRYVHRLRALDAHRLHARAESPIRTSGERPYRLGVKHGTQAAPQFAPMSVRMPALGADEVRLQVEVATLSLSQLRTLADVSGRATPAQAGPGSLFACVGRVESVGTEVTSLRAGARVVAYSQPALSSLVYAPESLCVRVPAHLSPQEAVALAAAFVPAYHCVDFLAQLREGEHILIHDAFDARGLAALQFAKLKGAVVHATARDAGARKALTGHGADHVYDGSHYDYIEQLRETRPGGLDVILNTLAGQHVRKSLQLLRPLGRFVELGGPGGEAASAVLQEVRRRSVSYHAFDFDELVRHQPGHVRELLKQVSDLSASGLLTPLRIPVVSSAEADAAVAHLLTGNGLEVVGVRFDVPATGIAPGLNPWPVNSESTYLVTGGLGGLGLEMMNWLVNSGARSLVLIGRSAPSPQARVAIDAARARGVAVVALQADVARAGDVEHVLSTIQENMLPLAGILHAAGVLDDGVILQQTPERFARVLGPKVRGAWNLHHLTADIPLDFFVLFSSIASVVGWSGQSNYAAANGFMDTLAHHRRAQGKPALSINWGPWSGSGMAANLADRDLQRMKEAGMTPLSPESGLSALTSLLVHSVTQAGVFEVNWARMFSREIDPARKTVLRDLIGAVASEKEESIAERLRAAPEESRAELLETEISSLLAGVLGMESGAALDRNKSVVDYGVASLMAMEFRNRLQAALKLKLPATLVLKYPTLASMARVILEQLRAEAATVVAEDLYWDPARPEVVQNREVNGPMATLTPSVLNWIQEGHDAHFNVGMLLEIDAAAFDLEALRTALRIVFTHHDGCRVQIHQEGNRFTQEIAPLGNESPLLEFDYRGSGYAAGSARMEAKNNELHRSFRFTRGCPLFRAAYYQLDDTNPHRLLLVFHHYISDAMSQHLFGQTLHSVYNKVKAREAVYLPAKTYTLIDWTKRLHEFAHREAAEALPYWLAKIERSRACFIADEFESRRARRMDDYQVYVSQMERADSERVLEYCREGNIEVSDLGTYAVVASFSKLTGRHSLWVDLITHARAGIFEDVSIPSLFGQVSESASILFELEPGAPAEEQVARVKAQRLEPTHGGIGLRALRFLNQDPEIRKHLTRDESPQVGLNFDLIDYGSQAGQSWIRFARESYGVNQSEHLRKTADQLRLAFFTSIRLRGGRLIMEIAYYRDRFHDTTVRTLVEDVFDTLIRAATGDGISAVPPRPAPRAELMEESGDRVAATR